MRTVGWISVGVVLGVVGLWTFQHIDWHMVASSWKSTLNSKEEPSTTTVAHTEASTTQQKSDVQQKAIPVDVKPFPGISWEITEMGVDALAVPVNSVNVKTNSQTYLIGNFSGTCFEIAGSGWSLVEGEKSGVICWWAGGGTEIGVFEENGKMVVKAGDIEEGSAEVPGARELKAKAKMLEPLFEIAL